MDHVSKPTAMFFGFLTAAMAHTSAQAATVDTTSARAATAQQTISERAPSDLGKLGLDPRQARRDAKSGKASPAGA